jgi:hypothetical protein
VIDPFVVVEVVGVGSDSRFMDISSYNLQKIREYKTVVIKDNGFNPTWNQVSLLLVKN